MRFKIYYSMRKVNKGAKVPRNVAFAMVVNFIEPKNKAKCIPNKIPASSVLFKF